MKDNIFTEEINQITLGLNDDKEYNQLIQQKHMHME